MSAKTITEVWQRSQARVGARLVLLTLADLADDDGCARPKIKTIARKAGLCERSVKRAIKKLVGAGELQVTRGVGRGNSSQYRVMLGWTQEKVQGCPER